MERTHQLSRLEINLKFPSDTYVGDGKDYADRLADHIFLPVLEQVLDECAPGDDRYVDSLSIELPPLPEDELPAAFEQALREALLQALEPASDVPSGFAESMGVAFSGLLGQLKRILGGQEVPDLLPPAGLAAAALLFEEGVPSLSPEEETAGQVQGERETVPDSTSSQPVRPLEAEPTAPQMHAGLPSSFVPPVEQARVPTGAEVSPVSEASFPSPLSLEGMLPLLRDILSEGTSVSEIARALSPVEAMRLSLLVGREPVSDAFPAEALYEALRERIAASDAESLLILDARMARWRLYRAEKARGKALPPRPEPTGEQVAAAIQSSIPEVDNQPETILSPEEGSKAESGPTPPDIRPQAPSIPPVVPDGLERAAAVESTAPAGVTDREKNGIPAESRDLEREEIPTESISPEGNTILEDRPAPEEVPDKVWARMESERPAPEVRYFIQDAGLTLLHPFIVPYLGNLGLVKKGRFVSDEARVEAVHQLRELVFPGLPHSNGFLLLEKIICGLPPEFLVPEEWEPDVAVAEEAEALLRSVCGHWRPLAKSSPNALRTAFLQRKGSVEYTEDGWIVRVEGSAIDLLLDELPWELSCIVLPWNEQVVLVEWQPE